MAEVLRNMTQDELRGLTVDGVKGVNLNKSKRSKNAREKFEIELQAQELRATQNAKPFARHAAREDFNKAIKVQVDDQVRKYGSVEKPEELKLPVVDWDKYSNLSNFDLTEEKNVADTNLSKHNPGLNVLVKTLVYKFKGYGQIYKVMESGPDAITRAIKTRAKLDQTINQDLEKPEVKPETNKTN